MRNTIDGAKIYESQIEMGLKFGVNIQSGIAGAVTFDRDAPVVNFFSLNSAQNINMPANEKGLTFIIVNNSAAANTATIKDSDTTTTRGTIAQNAAAIVTSDGTRWWVLPLT